MPRSRPRTAAVAGVALAGLAAAGCPALDATFGQREAVARFQPQTPRAVLMKVPASAAPRAGPAARVCCPAVMSRSAEKARRGRFPGRGCAAAARAGTAAAATLATCLLAGCGILSSPAAAPSPSPSPSSSSAPGPVPVPTAGHPATSPARPACPARPAGFSCTMRQRIAAVQRYLAHRPGLTGVVLRDRPTGAVWRDSGARVQVYMASTSKLAMAVTLLAQDQAGVIHLTSGDWATLYQMIHVSSDNAADGLWFKFGARFYTSYFPRIGLASARYLPQAGVSGPYWGEMTCPAADLSRLINYVLTSLPATSRDYLVNQLRHVAADQHFGVWGAGPASQPGNKDGWSLEKPGWIIDSVGFAGPGARYTLAMMNSLRGQGGYRAGTGTVTEVAALLLRGHQIPAPRVSATP